MNLLENPFFVLGATTRDTRRRLVEQADKASLTRDPALCTKARADLTNPRSRLAAELGWLPGVSPRQVEELLQTVQHEPESLLRARNLAPLARANLIASGLQCLPASRMSGDWARWVEWALALAASFEEIDPESLLIQINEDRAVAGFPTVPADDSLAEGLLERRRFFKTILRDKLDQMPAESLILAVTNAVEVVTSKGTRQAPMLLDELVDSYEVETKQFLDKEAESAQTLIASVRKATEDNAHPGKVDAQVSQLEKVIWNWDRVAQPIQFSKKARGLEHPDSVALARTVHSLAVELFNTHGLLAVSERLMRLLNEVFAEVPEVQDKVQEDLTALGDIRAKRNEAEQRDAESREQWAKGIYFETEIGFPKTKFRISEDGLFYGRFGLTLDSVTVARWGGINEYVNGILSKSTYKIAFGNDDTCSVVNLPDQPTYQIVVDKLWKAVGARIIRRMLHTLKTGRYLAFPEVNVGDGGISLRKRFLGSSKTFFPWNDVTLGSDSGYFLLGPRSDFVRRVQLSYLDVNNVHFLEAILRTFFKETKARKLTDLLA